MSIDYYYMGTIWENNTFLLGLSMSLYFVYIPVFIGIAVQITIVPCLFSTQELIAD